MINKRFEELGLSSELVKAIDLLKYERPTSVQAQVIPTVLEGNDIIVKSQTGSGKTAAFAIPICELIDWDENKPQALVLAPTRELAIQIKEDFFNIGRLKRIKAVAIYGKSPFHLQEKELKQKTHVVVGTPGRVNDHLNRGTLDTSRIKYLILDEADEMLNMGFIEQIEEIINQLPSNRVTLLLSATIPRELEALSQQFMNEPKFIEIEEHNPTSERILQEGYAIVEHQKTELLKDLTITENPDSCIVFCNTQLTVDQVYEELSHLNYTCDKIHGGMEQQDRLKVMDHFKRGYFRYLIATDVAARGIDIDNISLVINYDIPLDSENYIHRIGRTGRKGTEGKAITFVTKREERYLRAIEEYMDNKITIKERPNEERVYILKKAFEDKMNTRPEIKEDKGAKVSEGILKLHINAGKKTKMRPVDIVGTLCNIEGMKAEDIGIINVEDRSTYVEILNNKGELVYQALQEMPIKGRLRKVSKKIIKRNY